MTVNEYGLGEPDGIGEPDVAKAKGNLEAGLETSPDQGLDDVEPGTEFGLGDADSQPTAPVGEEPQPPQHGLEP